MTLKSIELAEAKRNNQNMPIRFRGAINLVGYPFGYADLVEPFSASGIGPDDPITPEMVLFAIDQVQIREIWGRDTYDLPS